MRLAVQIIAGIELLLLAAGILKLVLAGIKSDLAGQGMGQAYAAIGTILVLLMVVPALTLAYHDKALWLALILVLIASIFVLAVVVSVMAD